MKMSGASKHKSDLLYGGEIKVQNSSTVLANSEMNTTLRENSEQTHNLEKDLSCYIVGNTILGVVTYIYNINNLEFFICDSRCDDFKKIIELCNIENLKAYSKLPKKNEVFGVELQSIIWRAKLFQSMIDMTETNVDNKSDNFKIQLLDFGDVIEINSTVILYHIADKYQKIPAQAIMCHLNEIEYHEELSKEEIQKCLQQITLRASTFEIKDNKNKILQLKLLESRYQSESPTWDLNDDSSEDSTFGNELGSNNNPSINIKTDTHQHRKRLYYFNYQND